LSSLIRTAKQSLPISAPAALFRLAGFALAIVEL
jgi:hypothetical protein